MESKKLQNIIIESECRLSEDLLTIWNDIKITPEIWTESTNGEFWVVAVMGNEVIWYNDKVNGFNVSSYKTEGEFLDYWTENTDLQDLLWHLF